MTIRAINFRSSLIKNALSGRMGTFLVGLFVFGIYLSLGWFFMEPQVLWSPDEGAKWLQMQNLRWDDGLKLDIRYAGLEFDPNLRFVPDETSKGLLRLQDEQMFFRRLPLFPIISKIFHIWLGDRGLVILPAIGGSLMCMATIQLVDRSKRRVAMWILVAFASPVFIYALLFWEHTLASGLALLAAWLAFWNGTQSRLSFSSPVLKWIIVGLLMSISNVLRLEVAIFAGAFFTASFLLIPKQRRYIFFAGFILPIGLLVQAFVHNHLFGQAIPDNAAYLFYPFSYISRAGWGSVRDLLIGPFTDEAIDPGWLGTLWAATAIAILILSVARQAYPLFYKLWLVLMLIYILTAASFLFSSTPYRSAHGLLFTTPWVLFGYCRAWELWASKRIKARVVVLTAVFGLMGYIVGILFLRASSPHGGLEWGGRFFLTFFPLTAIMAGWGVADSGKHKLNTNFILAALIFLGLGFQIRGLLTIDNDKRLSQALVSELREAKETGYMLSSDLWWVPFNASSVYAEEAIFVFQEPEREAEWLDLVISTPVNQFAIVTLNQDWLDHALSRRPDFPFHLDQARQLDNLWVFYISR